MQFDNAREIKAEALRVGTTIRWSENRIITSVQKTKLSIIVEHEYEGDGFSLYPRTGSVREVYHKNDLITVIDNRALRDEAAARHYAARKIA